MIPQKEFYYMRHGQTVHHFGEQWDVFDVPLTPVGRLQAQEINPFIQTLPIQTVCFSPLIRAKDTKHLATQGMDLNHIEIEDLTECTGDVWVAMTREDLSNPPLAQEVETFISQAISGISQALIHPGPTLIVAHGGVHWALCKMLGIQDHSWHLAHCEPVHFFPSDIGWQAKTLV